MLALLANNLNLKKDVYFNNQNKNKFSKNEAQM
jgi:hypothetical protein